MRLTMPCLSAAAALLMLSACSAAEGEQAGDQVNAAIQDAANSAGGGAKSRVRRPIFATRMPGLDLVEEAQNALDPKSGSYTLRSKGDYVEGAIDFYERLGRAWEMELLEKKIDGMSAILRMKKRDDSLAVKTEPDGAGGHYIIVSYTD